MRLLKYAPWIVRDFAYAWRVRARRFARRADSRIYLGGDKQTIVVIPGVYERWEFMKPISERLHALGHPVHVVTDLGRNIAPIPDAAATVNLYLRDHDLTSVLLVTHSKGGLIGKYLMVVDDIENRIERMVAVASPFAGSSYAKYLPVKPLKAFVPTDKTLAMLAAKADVNTRITSVYPVFDGHLPEGSKLEGAKNVEVAVRGHFRVLVDPVALDAIVHAVEGVD